MLKRPGQYLAIFTLFTLFVAPTFGDELAKKIVGQWTGNSEATQKYWTEKEIEGPDRIIEDATKMSIAFAKDGKLVVQRKRENADDFKVEGTYKVVKSDESKNELTLKFVPNSEDGPPEIEVNVKLMDVKTATVLVIKPDNDPPIVFTQKTSKEEDKKDDSKDAPKKKAEKKTVNK